MASDPVLDQKRPDFGAQAMRAVRLERFLPYVIQQLWAAIAVARSLDVGSGHVLRTREWRVLMVIAALGPLTSVEIAQATATDSGTTARAVKMLIDYGFLVSRTPKSDRRKQVLALTVEGAAAHDQIAPVRSRFSEDVLAALTPNEQTELFQLLSKIQTRVNAMREPDDEWVETEA